MKHRWWRCVGCWVQIGMVGVLLIGVAGVAFSLGQGQQAGRDRGRLRECNERVVELHGEIERMVVERDGEHQR